MPIERFVEQLHCLDRPLSEIAHSSALIIGRSSAVSVWQDVEPYSGEEVRRILKAASDSRNAAKSERMIAAQLWVDTGRVFTDPFGQAIKPNSNYHAWKALLRRAGVRDGWLHDARHTAAILLLALGEPERRVMEIMGWSTTAMAPAISSHRPRSGPRTPLAL